MKTFGDINLGAKHNYSMFSTKVVEIRLIEQNKIINTLPLSERKVMLEKTIVNTVITVVI